MYLRKSRADAEAEAYGQGETLARHEAALMELARRMGASVAEIYREIVSGDSIAARPVMQRLLADVEAGLWDGVFVMEVERLARGDTIDQGLLAQTFRYSRTKIVTPSKTYDPENEFDEEYFEFGLFMSRREYKAINRRLIRGREASVREGKYVASKPPYGYKKVKLENQKGWTLAPDENADAVRYIFQLYVHGENGRQYGIQALARKLNEMRIPPSRHDYWEKSVIRDMLLNPVYAGKIRWNWRKTVKNMADGAVTKSRPRNYNEDCICVDGLHPALVDMETFEAAQRILADGPKPPLKYKAEIKNPLSGLIVCEKCGRKMTLRKGLNGKPDYIVCHARSCDNGSSRYEHVERALLDGLRAWAERFKIELAAQTERPLENDVSASVAASAKKNLEGEIKTLEGQLSRLHDLLEQGVYTPEQFLNRSKELGERTQKAANDLAALRQSEQERSAAGQFKAEALPQAESLVKIYDSLETPKQKNELLKEIVEKAAYLKICRAWRGSSGPADFDLEIFIKTGE
jgi:DNA invertase Pin-like site-specific DNA recombinase